MALREVARPTAADPALPAIAAWYEERGNSPAWVTDSGLSARGEGAIAAIKGAGAHGLDPSAYQLAAIEAARAASSSADRARLDWLITRALVGFAADVSVGRVNGSAVDFNIEVERRKPDYARLLREMADARDLAAWLDAQAPATPQYRALK
jgi:murein L,D-transpeptidase YcbB/YkuD